MLAIEKIFLWFLLYSFVGWLWETVLNIIMKKRFVDRGILNGPLCPIYGFGAMLAIYALQGEHSILAIFLSSGVLACTLEYFTSWAMEKLFHIRLWDYSSKPFNINGRVYLNGFLFFAAGCTVVKLWVQPFVMRILDSMNPMIIQILAIALAIILLIDVALTLAGLIGMNTALGHAEADIKAYTQRGIKQLDVHITAANERVARTEQALGIDRTHSTHESLEQRAQHKLQDATSDMRETLHTKKEELASRVRSRFNWQQRRLINAYPQMHSDTHPQLFQEIREVMHGNRNQSTVNSDDKE